MINGKKITIEVSEKNYYLIRSLVASCNKAGAAALSEAKKMESEESSGLPL